MPVINSIKLKIRRGTNAQRKTVILDQGELGYTIDTQRVFVGNGSLSGGIAIGSKAFTPDSSTSYLTTIPAEVNDLAYAKNLLYQLTATPSTNLNSWGFIGTTPDSTNNSLVYDSNNTLTISGSNAMKVLSAPAISVFPILTGATENYILSSAFSSTGGISGGSGNKITVSYDTSLYVDGITNKLGVSPYVGSLSSVLPNSFFNSICSYIFSDFTGWIAVNSIPSSVFSNISTLSTTPLTSTGISVNTQITTTVYAAITTYSAAYVSYFTYHPSTYLSYTTSLSDKIYPVIGTKSTSTAGTSAGVGVYFSIDTQSLTSINSTDLMLIDRSAQTTQFSANSAIIGFPSLTINNYGVATKYTDAVTANLSAVSTQTLTSLIVASGSSLTTPKALTGLSARSGGQNYPLSSAGFLYLPFVTVSGVTASNIHIPIYKSATIP